MVRQSRSTLGFAIVLALLGGAVSVTCPLPALGRASDGVRNILYVSIRKDPDVVGARQTSSGSQTATLTVKIRLSAHSQETNFFGIVPVTVSNFDPLKGSPEQEVWKENRCHHQRGGYPKMTVLTVDGTMANGNKKIPVSARFRWVGLQMPEDEVMAARGLVLGTDDVGPFISTRTETKASHFFVDLKMYTLPCVLSVDAAR